MLTTDISSEDMARINKRLFNMTNFDDKIECLIEEAIDTLGNLNTYKRQENDVSGPSILNFLNIFWNTHFLPYFGPDLYKVRAILSQKLELRVMKRTLMHRFDESGEIKYWKPFCFHFDRVVQFGSGIESEATRSAMEPLLFQVLGEMSTRFVSLILVSAGNNNRNNALENFHGFTLEDIQDYIESSFTLKFNGGFLVREEERKTLKQILINCLREQNNLKKILVHLDLGKNCLLTFKNPSLDLGILAKVITPPPQQQMPISIPAARFNGQNPTHVNGHSRQEACCRREPNFQLVQDNTPLRVFGGNYGDISTQRIISRSKYCELKVANPEIEMCLDPGCEFHQLFPVLNLDSANYRKSPDFSQVVNLMGVRHGDSEEIEKTSGPYPGIRAALLQNVRLNPLPAQIPKERDPYPVIRAALSQNLQIKPPILRKPVSIQKIGENEKMDEALLLSGTNEKENQASCPIISCNLNKATNADSSTETLTLHYNLYEDISDDETDETGGTVEPSRTVQEHTEFNQPPENPPAEIPLKKLQELFVRIGNETNPLEILIQCKKILEARQSLVFCKTTSATLSLAFSLRSNGFNCASYYESTNLRAFLDGSVRVLILTDALDLREFHESVPVLFNYEFPETIELYVKRRTLVGDLLEVKRLGPGEHRCKATPMIMSFVTELDEGILRSVTEENHLQEFYLKEFQNALD